MRIWFISPHDAIEGEVWGQRHALSSVKSLAAAGHEVTYWATNFSHVLKKFRSEGLSESTQDGVKTILLPTRSYNKNVSFSRIASFKDYSDALRVHGNSQPKPDVLIATLPTPFVDQAVTDLSRKYNAPLIAEFRDLWPELFALPFPVVVRPLVQVALAPLYSSRKKVFRASAAVAATCKTYLQKAIEIAPNLGNGNSLVLYHSGMQVSKVQTWMRDSSFDAELPSKKQGDIWVVYAGTLGNNYDVPCLIETAKLIQGDPKAKNYRFILAGDGPLRSRVEESIANGELRNVTYLGPVPLQKLARVYGLADIGLCIYHPGSTVVIPAKAYDLFAAGLPIINSLAGEFQEMIRQDNLGSYYKAGDPSSLAQSVIELGSDPSRRALIRENLLRIAPQFDRDLQYSRLRTLVEKIGAVRN
jgi:glycosyltransferase involved in cell wall biosynthesis